MDEDESLGYRYEGKVEFVAATTTGVPRVKLESLTQARQPVRDGEHYTILIKRDGSMFSKK